VRNWLKRKGSKPSPAPTAGQREADRAADREGAKLREVRKETRAIIEAAERLKALGESNDFAARIRHALGG
jgi:hypothetical protein